MARRRLVWRLMVGPFDGDRCRAQRVLFRLMNDATTPPTDSVGSASPEGTADAAAHESVTGGSVTDDSAREDADQADANVDVADADDSTAADDIADDSTEAGDSTEVGDAAGDSHAAGDIAESGDANSGEPALAAAEPGVMADTGAGDTDTDVASTDAAYSDDWFEHAAVVESPRSPRPPRSRKRVGITVFAVALIMTGIGILTYVGWEYYGTNIISKREHERIDNRLDAIWRYPTVADLLGPGTAPSSGSANAVLRIPKFGNSYAVPIIEGVGASALAKGVGHFSGTGPGQMGNYALAGHRVTHGEPFARLNTLKSGDQVIVETAEATYTYVLDTAPRDLTVDFHQTWVVDAVPIAPKGEAPPGMPHLDPGSPTQALLTLATCSEIFHTDNRSIGFGHLVKTTPR
jgi:sortase A